MWNGQSLSHAGGETLLRRSEPPEEDRRDCSATAPKVPEFNFEAIDALLQEIVLREAALEEFFAEAGTRPFVVVYEDLVQAYGEQLERYLAS